MPEMAVNFLKHSINNVSIILNQEREKNPLITLMIILNSNFRRIIMVEVHFKQQFQNKYQAAKQTQVVNIGRHRPWWLPAE